MVYEPQEDSFLLKEFVRKYAKGVVLDMGTGSGLQAIEAAHSAKTTKVYAIDIDPQSIAYCKKHHNHKHHTKVTWLLGDLFSPLKKNIQFDVIIFNAPYLPQDHNVRDIALEGGKQGHETIERFLKLAGQYLKPDGKILLVFSSLTPHIPRMLEENLFVGKELGKRHVFFEDIIVYELRHSPIRLDLQKKGVKHIEYFTHGKRGVIFTGEYKNKKVAIKTKRKQSTAVGTIPNEARMLKLANKHGLGPTYLFHSPKYIVYEFVEGEFLKNLIQSPKIKDIAKVVLEQCFQLDNMHIDKKDMTRPMKHVIVKGKQVTMIDWERAHKVKEPHNVTQFCQFVRNHVPLKSKANWLAAAKEYSKLRSRANFDKLVSML